MKIAVIIPTLNEEATLARTIRLLQRRGSPDRIIVADCGSTDATRDIAMAVGASVTESAFLPHRAAAMNAGAELARNLNDSIDVFWFLHADSVPPVSWRQSIERTLKTNEIVGGAFDFMWDMRGTTMMDALLLHCVCLVNRARFRISHAFFGDQGIFVSREAFLDVGGFEDVALLEDVKLCRALRRIGILRVAPARMKTSPRRFLRHGVLRQSLIDILLLATERIGLTLHETYGWYNTEKA